MVITHHGGQCFKVTFGDLTLVFDPISKGGTLPAVRFEQDGRPILKASCFDCHGGDTIQGA